MAKNQQIKQIWMLSREYRGLAGAGGVKDVTCELAEALARWNQRQVSVILPRYGFIEPQAEGFTLLPDPTDASKPLSINVAMNEPQRQLAEEVNFWYRRWNKVHLYLVEAERYRNKRAVYTYTREEEQQQQWQKQASGHHDYFAMNLLLQKAAIELIISLDQHPDVVHCHDGHTALFPVLVRELTGLRSYFRQTGMVVTIHNAGYGYHQEIADHNYGQTITELPREVLQHHRLQDKFDPLVAAGSYSVLSTVSENYARELQETVSDKLTGWLGHELKGRGIVLRGITNGIDPTKAAVALGIPENEPFTPGEWFKTFSQKPQWRKRLLAGLEDLAVKNGVSCHGHVSCEVQGPLFTFVGRLSDQKGVDHLCEVLPIFLARYSQAAFLVLGSGEGGLESWLRHLASQAETQGRFAYLSGFSASLAESIYAAGDFFLVPSRYEPCGLTDLTAQLYGNLPIVHHVGGLVKVIDGETGLSYLGDSPNALLGAMARGMQLYQQPEEVERLQRQALESIRNHYTWAVVMHKYLDLYDQSRELL